MAKLILKQHRNRIGRIWNSLKPSFLSKNTMGERIATFNRGGYRRSVNLDTMVDLESTEYYKGYLYASIRTRANRTAQLAQDSLKTYINNVGQDDKESDIPHPYLKIIDSSPTFSNYYFYKAVSTFIDLTGGAYILAIRNFTPGVRDEQGVLTSPAKYGELKELKLLNPYNVQRVVNAQGELAGYREYREGLMRDIPAQMMIEVREFNPFNMSEGFAMVDAAKEDQYLNRQTGLFTRSAIKNNVGQRGLITSELLMEQEDFENFMNRVEKTAGEGNAGKFMFSNGSGAITYTDMQIDLDKLALSSINEISRESLFSVAGVSKTILGLEMSGVTRESGKVQSDLFTQQQTIPQLQLIADAFNQDYRNAYPDQYNKSKIELRIDSPLKTDRDAELLDAQIINTKAIAAQTLIKTGFDPAEALETVGLSEMSFTAPPVQTITPLTDTAVQHADHLHDEDDPILKVNELAPALRQVIAGKQSTLMAEINAWQGRVLQASLQVVAKNELTSSQEDEVIDAEDRNKYENELVELIIAYYLGIVPLFASQTIKDRFREFQLSASFSMTAAIQKLIATHAGNSAKSHLDTVLTEIYNVARQAATEGKSRSEIISAIIKRYNGTISQAQATRIARTETNQSIATAQFEADKQFVAQNGLEGRVFKQWVTRSDNPCPFCMELERRTSANPIPFSENFVNLGESVQAQFENKDSTTTRTYVVGYEPIGSGTLHPNCSCIYRLIIMPT